MKKILEFKNITKTYSENDKPAVNNLNLDIYDGEIVVLVGPSGCGKTSTMKMINRLIDPTEGKIILEGEDISKIDPLKLRQDIGYVIQNVGLFPHMTVAQNIATAPNLKKWPKKKTRARVDKLLKLVGLEPSDFRKRLPAHLSGGQQQRIGVARALAADPPIMLMDEPFGALDPITRAHLQSEFLKIQQDVNKTILFVTHDMDEAVKMGDKIVVMRDGKIVQYGTPIELLQTPADSFIANLTGQDRAIKMLTLISVEEILNKIGDTTSQETETKNSILNTCSLKTALLKMLDARITQLSVYNEDDQEIGTLTLDQIVRNVKD